MTHSRVNFESDTSHKVPGAEPKVCLITAQTTHTHVLKTALETNGFNVTPYTHPTPAMPEILRRAFDLVISDYEIPDGDMDGAKLVKTIRACRLPRIEQIPIVICVNTLDPAVLDMLKKMRASGVLAHPIDPVRLISMVREMLLRRGYQLATPSEAHEGSAQPAPDQPDATKVKAPPPRSTPAQTRATQGQMRESPRGGPSSAPRTPKITPTARTAPDAHPQERAQDRTTTDLLKKLRKNQKTAPANPVVQPAINTTSIPEDLSTNLPPLSDRLHDARDFPDPGQRRKTESLSNKKRGFFSRLLDIRTFDLGDELSPEQVMRMDEHPSAEDAQIVDREDRFRTGPALNRAYDEPVAKTAPTGETRPRIQPVTHPVSEPKKTGAGRPSFEIPEMQPIDPRSVKHPSAFAARSQSANTKKTTENIFSGAQSAPFNVRNAGASSRTASATPPNRFANDFAKMGSAGGNATHSPFEPAHPRPSAQAHAPEAPPDPSSEFAREFAQEFAQNFGDDFAQGVQNPAHAPQPNIESEFTESALLEDEANYLGLSQRMLWFVSLFSIAVGVAFFLGFDTLRNNAEPFMVSKLADLGQNTFWLSMAGESGSLDSSTGIDTQDLANLRAGCSACEKITPIVFGPHRRVQVQYENRADVVFLDGVNDEYFTINNDAVEVGRLLAKDDIDQSTAMAVIGSAVRDELFGKPEDGDQVSDPIGKKIRIGKLVVTVVGVIQEKDASVLRKLGSASGYDINRRILIPFTYYQERMGTLAINMLQSSTKSSADIDKAIAQVVQVLRVRHDRGTVFATQSTLDWTNLALAKIKSLSIIGVSIAAVCFVLGGMAIMSIVGLSVVHRARLRKESNRKPIPLPVLTMQVFIDALTISAMGGLMGVAIGVLLNYGIGFWAKMSIDVAWTMAIIGLAIALLVGFISASHTAKRAGRLASV